jgi:hypothetical protein
MARRATRAGAPLGSSASSSTPSSASRVPQIRKRRAVRDRRDGRERDARERPGSSRVGCPRARTPARGVAGPGRPRTSPGTRGSSGVCQREKKPSSPRVFVKRANAEMGVPDAPLGLLGELGLVHEVGARHAGEVLGDVHQAHRVGLRGWRSRPGWCAVVLTFRGRWPEARWAHAGARLESPAAARRANHHFFPLIVWENSLKQIRTDADSEWHRLASPSPSRGEIEPERAARHPSITARFQTAFGSGPATPSDRRVCARPRVASAPSEPNPNPSREHGRRRAALHGHDRLEGDRSRQARGASSIRIRPISSLDENILRFQQRRTDAVPSPPPPR